MTVLPAARTPAEARVHLAITPCGCGTRTAEWDRALGEVDGELADRYTARCPGCDTAREVLLALPATEPPLDGPRYGAGRSALVDAGQWLEVADRYARSLPADPAALAPADRATAADRAAAAVAALDQVLAFLPAAAAAVPTSACWTEQGRAVLRAEPGRLDAERLAAVRAASEQLWVALAG